MNGLTAEEKQKALAYIKNGADFMLMPSPELCSMIINDSPQTQGINRVMTSILLGRKPIRLDPDIVVKYCKGTLDRKNTWLFDNVNIKVVPHQLKKEVKVRTEEDKKRPPKIEEVDGKLVAEKKVEKNNSSLILPD